MPQANSKYRKLTDELTRILDNIFYCCRVSWAIRKEHPVGLYLGEIGLCK